jgi:hypothetical protein
MLTSVTCHKSVAALSDLPQLCAGHTLCFEMAAARHRRFEPANQSPSCYSPTPEATIFLPCLKGNQHNQLVGIFNRKNSQSQVQDSRLSRSIVPSRLLARARQRVAILRRRSEVCKHLEKQEPVHEQVPANGRYGGRAPPRRCAAQWSLAVPGLAPGQLSRMQAAEHGQTKAKSTACTRDTFLTSRAATHRLPAAAGRRRRRRR